MLVDSDTASLDAYPSDVVVFDDPLPQADSGSSAVTEVLVIGHVDNSVENAHDALQEAMHDLSVPIPADADAETLEARRLALVAEGQKIASMRRLTEAHQREVDRAAFGTPPPGKPSRLGTIRQRGAAVTSICAASTLANLLDETLISDELASNAGTDHLANLLGQLHVSSEPAADLESVGSTDPMPVDSDTASFDTFPTNVTIYNDPLP